MKTSQFNDDNIEELVEIIKEPQKQEDEYDDEGKEKLVDKKFTFLLSHIPSQFLRNSKVWFLFTEKVFIIFIIYTIYILYGEKYPYQGNYFSWTI